ncbi:hypothetical protein ANCCEY_14928 [Ancylostoma ceylanicum]|uniref:Uncharacterized protein n=1 Tax=Ancylostoma ceylanicum TaxID=53326 RepID=A0A0D6L4B6_9BILA|nr:hypothetical protein ANCCEY_14928 [Ancylostoma ceylanicum]
MSVVEIVIFIVGLLFSLMAHCLAWAIHTKVSKVLERLKDCDDNVKAAAKLVENSAVGTSASQKHLHEISWSFKITGSVLQLSAEQLRFDPDVNEFERDVAVLMLKDPQLTYTGETMHRPNRPKTPVNQSRKSLKKQVSLEAAPKRKQDSEEPMNTVTAVYMLNIVSVRAPVVTTNKVPLTTTPLRAHTEYSSSSNNFTNNNSRMNPQKRELLLPLTTNAEEVDSYTTVNAHGVTGASVLTDSLDDTQNLSGSIHPSTTDPHPETVPTSDSLDLHNAASETFTSEADVSTSGETTTSSEVAPFSEVISSSSAAARDFRGATDVTTFSTSDITSITTPISDITSITENVTSATIQLADSTEITAETLPLDKYNISTTVADEQFSSSTVSTDFPATGNITGTTWEVSLSSTSTLTSESRKATRVVIVEIPTSIGTTETEAETTETTKEPTTSEMEATETTETSIEPTSSEIGATETTETILEPTTSEIGATETTETILEPTTSEMGATETTETSTESTTRETGTRERTETRTTSEMQTEASETTTQPTTSRTGTETTGTAAKPTTVEETPRTSTATVVLLVPTTEPTLNKTAASSETSTGSTSRATTRQEPAVAPQKGRTKKEPVEELDDKTSIIILLAAAAVIVNVLLVLLVVLRRLKKRALKKRDEKRRFAKKTEKEYVIKYEVHKVRN